MDHRCLYGHRVPSDFRFAIQSRSCPTCGAPTLTLNGYAAARKLATEAGLDAVAAFHALRVIEADWVLSPAAPAEAPASPGPAVTAAPAVEPPPATEEEVVVVEDEPPRPAPAPPAAEPRIVARARSEKRAEAAPGRAFGKDEEDFFEGA